MTAALLIDGVSRAYGRRTVLDRVSFAVPAGSIVGVLGANGAGKTTLFSIIAGYIRADAGRVLVQGRTFKEALGRIGILPQDAWFQGDLPILEQLTWLLRFVGRSQQAAEAEVAQMLVRLGLGDYLGQRATELSHGMYKRLALAQAFLGDPAVVLLVEPTAGLDPVNARGIRSLIREVRSADVAVVVSSHDLAEMQELCDRVVILERGVLRADGTVSEVCRRHPLLRVVCARPLTGEECEALGRLPGVSAVEQRQDGMLAITLSDAGDAAAMAVQALLTARGIMIRRADLGESLEQAFLSLTAPPAPRS